jgi:acetylornithine/succinyldiaminopimelate/putrescine aminotransferase
VAEVAGLARAAETGDRARRFADRGFTAVKYDPVPGPWRTFVPKEHIRRAVKVMRAVRDTMIIAPPLVMTRSHVDELIDKARKSLEMTLAEGRRLGKI